MSRIASPRRMPSVPSVGTAGLVASAEGMIGAAGPTPSGGGRGGGAGGGAGASPALVTRIPPAPDPPRRVAKASRPGCSASALSSSNAVQVESLDQAGERGRLARHAVQLEPVRRDRERDREVFEQPEQRPEFRLLGFLRPRVAKQRYTAREPRRNRVESRHTASEQSRTRNDPRQRGPACEPRHAPAPAAPAGRARPTARPPVAEPDRAA